MASETIGGQFSSLALVAAGKTPADMSSLGSGELEDLVFVNQRLDGQVALKDRVFRHCVFVGLGLKEASFTDTKFEHCTFVRCYFRAAKIRGCSFVGSRFEGCDLQEASLVNCQLMYTRWRSTSIEPGQILANTPEWPNVAHELMVETRNNALTRGRNGDARWLHRNALSQTREHNRRILVAYNDYYRNKYDWSERMKGGAKWISLHVERWAWGYGEQPLYLILSGGLVVVACAAYYLLASPEMFGASDDYTANSVMMAMDYSIRAFASAEPPSSLTFNDFGSATTAEALFGMVFASLLAAVVFRWISTRDF